MVGWWGENVLGRTPTSPQTEQVKNTAIAKVFSDIADLLELKGENAFKVRAYQKAVRAIEHYPKEIQAMLEEGEE